MSRRTTSASLLLAVTVLCAGCGSAARPAGARPARRGWVPHWIR
jgi:hypothetical protein